MSAKYSCFLGATFKRTLVACKFVKSQTSLEKNDILKIRNVLTNVPVLGFQKNQGDPPNTQHGAKQT